MGKFIELIDDDNQSVLINTDWIIYIEEDTKIRSLFIGVYRFLMAKAL